MLATVIMVAGVFLSMLIGWFVFTRDPSQRINRLYALLTLSFIALTIFNYFTLGLSSHLLLFMRLVVLSTTVASAALFLLVIEMRRSSSGQLHKRHSLKLYVALTIAICALELTPQVFSSLTNELSPTPVPAWGVAPFVAHFMLSMAGAITLLFLGTRKGSAKQRKTFSTMLIGMLPILVLAPVTSVVLPIFFQNTALIMFSPLYLLFFLATVGYAIVRHGLFDIKQAAIRTAAYVLSLLTLSAVYFFMAYFASVTVFNDNVATGISTSPVNIALALVLAFIFQPVKQFFDRVTDRIFYKDRYRTDEFIARLSEVLTTTTDLRSLLQRAAVEIGTTLKAEYAFFSVRYHTTHRISAGTPGHEALSLEEVDLLMNELDIEGGRETIVTELLPDGSEAKNLLRRHRIALALVLRHKGQALGVLALGEQRSSSYSGRDVRVLSTISDELVIAIQNSLSIQEVRDINVHLQQRIEEATTELRLSNSKLKELDKSKDEFISMASHQLRTPLTAVKGYVSMLLEGDIGKVSQQQREVLEQAYDSSQRMVFLIGDFLNVSRIQTGKFVLEPSSINFTKLVEEEVDQLKDTARARHITLNYEVPSTAIVAVADENKLRQVMMNFMDNAIFYSPSGKSVDVQLYRDAEGIVFRVNDHGIGVPKAEQAKLFTKFFRADNAKQQRPDGTGIGIYMAKKVVLAHGGSLIFESKEGVGSTFGFKLPLKNEANQLDNQPDATAGNTEHDS